MWCHAAIIPIWLYKTINQAYVSLRPAFNVRSRPDVDYIFVQNNVYIEKSIWPERLLTVQVTVDENYKKNVTLFSN